MNNALLSSLNAQSFYLLSSAVVAIIIGLEGQVIRKTKGKLPKSSLFYIASLLDTTWFFVSIAAIYLISFEPVALTVPVAYSVYTVTGWIYGSRLLRKDGMPDNPKDLIIPMPYVAFSQSFALIFFTLCLFVLLFSQIITINAL